jgi:hypothetical protein
MPLTDYGQRLSARISVSIFIRVTAARREARSACALRQSSDNFVFLQRRFIDGMTAGAVKSWHGRKQRLRKVRNLTRLSSDLAAESVHASGGI